MIGEQMLMGAVSSNQQNLLKLGGRYMYICVNTFLEITFLLICSPLLYFTIRYFKRKAKDKK